MSNNVLVIGDSILDETIVCSVLGTSLETPTLKVKQESAEVEFGGASNVVKHLLELGARVTYITVIGEDKYSDFYHDWEHPSLNIIPIFTKRKNVVKSRFWVEKAVKYKYLQVNIGDKKQYEDSVFNSIVSKISQIKNVDCIVLIDYGIGLFLNKEQTDSMMPILKKINAPIIFSSQLSSNKNNYPNFKGVDFMCMNQEEALENLDSFEPNESKIIQLSSILESNICVTLGDKGSIFKSDSVFINDSYKVQSIDTCGAGDAFLASFILNFKKGNLSDCNKWAALSTKYLGTKTPSRFDL